MNKHLKLVRELHDTLSLSNTEVGAAVHFSDMDIVNHQALLMQEGSTVLNAIKAGDMVEILLGLVNLATVAVEAIAVLGSDVVDLPVAWRHDGSVVSVMRTLSDKINQCSSGKPEDYSAVYCLCVHLTRSFVNADFDKAFQVVQESRAVKSAKQDAEGVHLLKQSKAPDLSDCLYE